MRSIFSSLNARLIIIHLIAFWFFLYGSESLAFLHDHNFFNPMFDRINKVTFPDRYAADTTFIEQFGNMGLLAGYVISWFVCSKKNWHWINGVIAFVVAFGLGYLKWFGWDHLYKIFLTPGTLFKAGSIWRYIIDGGIMVLIGLLLLLLKPVIRFIDNGDPANKRKIEADKIARRIK